MRVAVKIGDRDRGSRLPECERWIDVDGRCPSCNQGNFRVIGDVRRQHVESHHMTAPAIALCCAQEVGSVHVEFSTIFGIEEDERVLHGRPRVY